MNAPCAPRNEETMSYIKHRSEESSEDYLETILILSKRLEHVRSIDIAKELSYSKPSVSVAMKNLRNAGMIETSSEGYITLTEKGMQRASQVYEKHVLFTEWLTRLGVDPTVARDDACKIEHDISAESFEAIKKHIKNGLPSSR